LRRYLFVQTRIGKSWLAGGDRPPASGADQLGTVVGLEGVPPSICVSPKSASPTATGRGFDP